MSAGEFMLREICDHIVSFDSEDLSRRPVRKREVIELFRQDGDRRAQDVVAALPETADGCLDPQHVDALLVRVHCEMQRLSEEMQHGRRVLELLAPLLSALREQGAPGIQRVVDIGCGTGFVLRWLARNGNLSSDVELIGVDFNPCLIAEARRLAGLENLKVRFDCLNALTMPEQAVVYLSTGVLHHIPHDRLPRFFQQHDRPATCAFVHFDFQPSPMVLPGAWLFHRIRMREPLACHDGVVSALRAYDAETLVSAARQGAPAFCCGMFGQRLWPFPFPRVFHALLGIRPTLQAPFRRHLGRRAVLLGELA